MGQGRQILLLLRFIPKLENVIAAQRIVCRHDQPHRAVHPRQFLNGDDILDVTQSRAAIFFGENHTEEAHLAELGHNLDRKMRGFVPFHDVLRDFAFREFPDAAPQLLLFRCESEVHAVLGG